jgi:hypothetical protein
VVSKSQNYNAYAPRNIGHFESTVETPVMHMLPPTDPGGPRGITHYGGHSEPVPTCATMWMDGALMGVPFSSLPVPELTKVVKLTLFFAFLSPGFFGNFFFFTPHTRPGLTYLPTFRPLAYVPWPPPSLPHLPTYLPTYPPIYLPTRPIAYLPINLPTYVSMH